MERSAWAQIAEPHALIDDGRPGARDRGDCSTRSRRATLQDADALGIPEGDGVLGAGLASLVQHPGNLNADVIENEQGLFVLDVTQLAGADRPSALVAWVVGREPDPAWLHCRPGIVVARNEPDAIESSDVTTA